MIRWPVNSTAPLNPIGRHTILVVTRLGTLSSTESLQRIIYSGNLMPRSRTFRKFILRVLAIGVGLLLVELILDIGRNVSPRMDYQLSPAWKRVVVADDVLGHRMSPYYPGNDEWGFRNTAVPERCEILAIGDSMTYGFAATPENSWPRQLERLTGKSTYNMSCGGYGFCQYELLLERGLSLHPSIVILGTCMITDFTDAYHSVYTAQANCPAKRFKNNDANFLSVLQASNQSSPVLEGRLEEPDQDTAIGSVHEWLSFHCSLYAVARELRAKIGSKQYYSILREDVPPQDAFEVCLKRPNRVSYNASSSLRTVFFSPELCMRRYDMQDPRIQEGVRIGRQIILSMRSKVEDTGAKFFVVLVPSKCLVYRDNLTRSDSQPPQRYFQLVDAERAFTESLEQFLRTNKIEEINPTNALRGCLSKDERPFPESDDEHLNKTGYAAVAETIGSRLGHAAK
jgi:hypothetical protein